LANEIVENPLGRNTVGIDEAEHGRQRGVGNGPIRERTKTTMSGGGGAEHACGKIQSSLGGGEKK